MDIIKKVDYGVITFGRFKDKKWSSVKRDYLEYLITDECLTNQENKDIAKKELAQRDICDGQITLF